jgi:hypothetical protein
MTHPVAKRADQLVVGDRVPDEYLPHRFNKGPAEVVFVADDGDDADACQLFHPPVDQDAADAAAFDRGWIAEHRRAAKVDPPIAELDDVSCWVCGGSFPHSHAKAD